MPTAVPLRSGRRAGVLVALAGALTAAFVFAPRLLANRTGADFRGESDLGQAFREAFVDYWHSGTQEFTVELANIVDYWFRYHLAKAVLATLLTVVLVMLAVLLWRAFMAAGGTGLGTRVALATSGGVATVLALCALVLVLANAQGTVTPFASLLPMATGDDSAEVRAEIGHRLADGTRIPPLDVMIDDFARYHLAMAVLAAVTAVSLLGVCALLWRTRVRSPDRRSRRVLASFGTLSALLALLLIVVAVANTTNASDPVSGLAALFAGGW
ncbi:hypothetical protein [Nocardia sp. A7]|uniref:hypothetical protein n=1 Tax=Nocardia sp. A7 TaxID=2789274 RepID=UPI00397A889A